MDFYGRDSEIRDNFSVFPEVGFEPSTVIQSSLKMISAPYHLLHDASKYVILFTYINSAIERNFNLRKKKKLYNFLI